MNVGLECWNWPRGLSRAPDGAGCDRFARLGGGTGHRISVSISDLPILDDSAGSVQRKDSPPGIVVNGA